jgi:hypothetical protein
MIDAMMEAFDDWVLPVLIALLVALLAFGVFAIGYLVYDRLVAETFELRKDSWTCEKSHTETNLQPMLVGKVTILMPMKRNVCDVWVR